MAKQNGLNLTSLFFGAIILGGFAIMLLVGVAGLFGALLSGGGATSASGLTDSQSGNNNQTTGQGTVPISELIELARAAGIPNDHLAMAVAIALAESRGNPNAVDNDSNGTVDRGLWQINTCWASVLPGNEFNPAYNAQSMAYISQGGTNWTPWVTYQTGAYRQYLPEAELAVSGQGY